MIRNIVKIDEEKCSGCGLCAAACHEGAIGMVNGKAKLLRDDYCDGLGACLPACPAGAISVEQREAAAFDEAAVKARMEAAQGTPPSGGCPGTKAHILEREEPLACGCPGSHDRSLQREEAPVPVACAEPSSMLMQWPVQMKLLPINAPYFDGANLLISADCAAYAYGNFHAKFMKSKVTVIGCPKLDSVDYSEKLTAILKNNDIRSLTVVRMEVPCCGGLEHAAVTALKNCGKMIPWQVVTLSADGNIL
ncbi:Electron transport complex subunit RsxB [bioreactor metagenome]|uniref:Electron transport complex subunit RsxB n=1 Tax=bioreactor metagenome TaxID=1076179 RepID=A0A644YC08_9ZZZZ